MGARDLVDAFNEAVGDKATCTKATLQYEGFEGVQYQILTFRGTDWTGQPFEVKSERLPPETDVNLAARAVGAQLREQMGKSDGSSGDGAAGPAADGAAGDGANQL